MEPESLGSGATQSKKNKPGTLDLELFKATVQQIKAGNKEIKIQHIRKLFALDGLIRHYMSGTTKRIIISDNLRFEYPHEFHTARKLADENYDVIFVPKGYFKRSEKKFDVFVVRGHVLLEVELKYITSGNPDTIGKAILNGSDQSSKLVLDIQSGVRKRDLIEGLKAGCTKNNLINEILLFYRSQFYRLRKDIILSKKIFNTIK